MDLHVAGTGPLYRCSLVSRLHSPAFYRTVYKNTFMHGAIKSWGVESANEANTGELRLIMLTFYVYMSFRDYHIQLK